MAIPFSCQWLVCSGHVTIFRLIREILWQVWGQSGKDFSLQKNGSSSAFPSLPACTTFPSCWPLRMWCLELWQPHCNLEVRSPEIKPNMNVMLESRHKKSLGPQWCDCAAELSPWLLSFEPHVKDVITPCFKSLLDTPFVVAKDILIDTIWARKDVFLELLQK